MLSNQIQEKINRELKKYPPDQKQSAVMAALRFVQDEKGWISNDDMADVADYLGMPHVAVYEVATFYHMYNLKPMGKYTLTVCTNLSCQLMGANETLEYLKGKLGIGLNETTADGKVTLIGSGGVDAAGEPELDHALHRVGLARLPAASGVKYEVGNAKVGGEDDFGVQALARPSPERLIRRGDVDEEWHVGDDGAHAAAAPCGLKFLDVPGGKLIYVPAP